MIGRKALAALEFDKILEALSRYAKSEATRAAVMQIAPMGNREGIERRSESIEEIRRLSREGNPLEIHPFKDISGILERVRPEGAVLEPADLLLLVPVLTMLSLIPQGMKGRGDLPLLQELTSRLTGFPDLLSLIERSVDNDGKVKDEASPELAETRRRIERLVGRIRRRLEEIVRSEEVAPFLQDDFVTERGGRWVIPVRMDSKGLVRGVVHDVSNSGETAFMEPLEIVGPANELENLRAEEKAEVIRILRDISDRIRAEAGDLERQFEMLVHLDVLNSIALFADHLDLHRIDVNDSFVIDLERTAHPSLLMMEREGQGGKTVPLDMSLGDEERVMAITGPNAGGKTIAIKTVGLVIAMALSGMPVPAGDRSTVPLVTDLLIDIGDEQSIESSLSTFSSHISRIAEIVKRADSRTVVLLDELGTGTEPVQGAAIACSVLEELREKGAIVLATTHLTDIVAFVYRSGAMVNASMEFDEKTHRPLYRLVVGEPGQSHALEIAQRYGLPGRVVERARRLAGALSAELHDLLSDLKSRRKSYEVMACELESERKALAGKERLLDERLAAIDDIRKKAREEALRDARKIIAEAKRQAREVLEELKRAGSRKPLERLHRLDRELDDELRGLVSEPVLPLEEIGEGDKVFVRPVGCDGTVMKVDRRKELVTVKAGAVTIEVTARDVGPSRGKKGEGSAVRRREHEAVDLPSEVNLIGMRVDEALPVLERFLDGAAVKGGCEIRVIHGIGTGALMKAVRGYLKGHTHVKDFRRGERHEGGDGVTVVTMK